MLYLIILLLLIVLYGIDVYVNMRIRKAQMELFYELGKTQAAIDNYYKSMPGIVTTAVVKQLRRAGLKVNDE